MHHLLAGFKSIVTDRTCTGIESCRKNCGGAGYSSFSGLPTILGAISPFPTFEGDNTVMLLQSSNFLSKIVNKVISKGKTLPAPFNHDNNHNNNNNGNNNTSNN